MRTIYRESLNVRDDFTTYNIAPGAEVVHVEPAGHDRLEFWYLTDTHWDTAHRTFIVTGTGHPAPDDPAADRLSDRLRHGTAKYNGIAKYIGCTGRNTAGLVWHLWELS